MVLALLLACSSADDTAAPADTAGGTSDGGALDGGTSDGGTSDGGSPGDGGADGGSQALSFATDIWPLYIGRCEDCHWYWGGTATEVHAALTGPIYDPPLVQPGDPDGSVYYGKLTASPPEGERMPLHPQPYTEAEVEALRAWIAAGAAAGDFDAAVGAAWRSTEHRCQMCHDDWQAGGSLYDHVTTASSGGWDLVVPGQPEQSLLLLKVDGSTPPVGAAMPPALPYLTDDELALVRQWITEGAQP